MHSYIVRWFTCSQTVTHPSINWACHRVTSLIKTNVLPLNQTANLATQVDSALYPPWDGKMNIRDNIVAKKYISIFVAICIIDRAGRQVGARREDGWGENELVDFCQWLLRHLLLLCDNDGGSGKQPGSSASSTHAHCQQRERDREAHRYCI